MAATDANARSAKRPPQLSPQKLPPPNLPPASPLPEIRQLDLADLCAALIGGLRDFQRAPLFGLFFAAVYVLAGYLMVIFGADHVLWVLALSLAFPLYGPFAAVGLYEVSRRIEAGLPLDWRQVLGVVWAERGRQIPWLGAVIVIFVLFWTFIAHMIFALILGLHPIINISDSWAMFLTGQGLTMVLVELAVGTVMAMFLFAMTVVSLPLLLDKELDFVTAILHSIATFRDNLAVMLVWAALVGILTLIALLPWFLGLIVVFPVLGHATWHLYRRALG